MLAQGLHTHLYEDKFSLFMEVRRQQNPLEVLWRERTWLPSGLDSTPFLTSYCFSHGLQIY